MILTEGNFQSEFVMEASVIHANHLIKVETMEEGEVDGMMNSNDLEEAHLRCDQGETVVQWVVEMKEEEDVQAQSVEENDPLCLQQSEQSDVGFGGQSCSRKVKRQSSSKAKVRSTRKERGRREMHENPSLEDDIEAVGLQGKELMVKFWEGPLDNGTLRDIMVLNESPVKKEEQQQRREKKEGTQPSGSRKLGVGFKVAGEGKLKAVLMKRKENKKYRKIVRACRNCESCRRENCGACKYCQDMRKFGGRGVLKQKCALRACLYPQI